MPNTNQKESAPKTGNQLSNWLVAGCDGRPLTDLHDDLSYNGSNIVSAGLSHAERVDGLATVGDSTDYIKVSGMQI